MRCASLVSLCAVTEGDAVGAVAVAVLLGAAVVLGAMGRRLRVRSPLLSGLPVLVWQGCAAVPVSLDLRTAGAALLVVALVTAYSVGRYLGQRAEIAAFINAIQRRQGRA